MLCVSCAEAPPQQPNFAFVLVDTLRRDHLASYGYERKTTPFIDSLAENGLVLERAIAQAPWTSASMASLWTSRFPSEAGGVVVPDGEGVQFLERTGVSRLAPSWTTLAEALRRAGYRTLAVVANPYAGPVVGLLRGFEVSRQEPLEDARHLTDVALSLLDSHLASSASPFFLYVHYVDPHEPTDPPEPYRSLFSAPDGAPHEQAHVGWSFGRATDPDAEEVRVFRSHKIALYDGALRYVDDQIRRLAEGLERRGSLSSTVFVIASDHGEEFWDHARFGAEVHADPRGVAGIGHGHSLFGELVDVPLVFSGPGVPVARVAAQVRNLDIAPTILGLAGVDWRDLEMRGQDLVGTLRDTPFPELPALSENLAYGPEAKSIQLSGRKLVRYATTKTGRTEFFFDRNVDPGERDPRPADSRDAALLGETLDAMLASRPDPSAPASRSEIDQETREQLRAMGYAE